MGLEFDMIFCSVFVVIFCWIVLVRLGCLWRVVICRLFFNVLVSCIGFFDCSVCSIGIGMLSDSGGLLVSVFCFLWSRLRCLYIMGVDSFCLLGIRI